MSDATDRSSELLAAAHAYRNRGWRVIQLHRVIQGNLLVCSCKSVEKCPSKGKHPIDAKWQDTPAMSGPDLEEAWNRPGRHRMNIGLATGAPSGFWVLDVDPKDNGIAELKTLIAEHGPLPQTYVVRTGSGGYHYYWLMPDGEDVRNSQSGIAPGLDVRGTGGQVVAPPSRTDIGDYTVKLDVPLAAAPAWLLDLIRKPAATGPTVTSDDVPDRSHLDEAERDRLDTYANGAVKSMLERLRKLGETGWDGEPWDGTTYEVACSLLEIANSPWNAYTERQAYLDFFATAPRDTNFGDDRVNVKWDSAKTKVGNKARAVPPGRPKQEDDFFFGGDVRVDPTVAAGGNAPGGAPAGAQAGTSSYSPHDFFEKSQLNVTLAARAVRELGSVAWGRDEAFWSYADGLWSSDRHVVRDRLTRLLSFRYRPAHASAVEDWMRFNVPKIDCDPVEQYVNFTNGMLDWRTGEIVEHDEKFLSTVQIHTAYDADAECPTFDAWLEDVLSEDYVKVAWEMLGYLLYNGNPLQIAFLLYGSGGNGKGTLMRVMKEMLGQTAYAAESLDMLNGNNFSAINLFGKTANLAGDIDGTYQESTANFKKLTGEDVYAGERKYGDRFTFVSWAVPVFSANKIPGSADVTEGYLRRWVMVHFEKTFEKRRLGVSDTFTPELAGITAKAIRALRVLMDRGEFLLEGEAAKGKEEFAMAIDQVRQWTKYATIHSPGRHEPRDSVYDAYKVWAERTGSGKLRAMEFYHRLEAIGYPSEMHHGIPSVRGLIASPTTIGADASLGATDSFFA